MIAIDCALALDDGPGTPSPSFAGRRDDIVSALEMFRQPNPRDPTPDVTDQCARTVQAILETLSRWQEARAGDSKPVAGGTAGLGGFFQRVKDLLAQFTSASPAVRLPSCTPRWLEGDPLPYPALPNRRERRPGAGHLEPAAREHSEPGAAPARL